LHTESNSPLATPYKSPETCALTSSSSHPVPTQPISSNTKVSLQKSSKIITSKTLQQNLKKEQKAATALLKKKLNEERLLAKEKEKAEKAENKVPFIPFITVQIDGANVNKDISQAKYLDSYAHVPISRIAGVTSTQVTTTYSNFNFKLNPLKLENI
jgi:hypothetical protein